MGIDFLDLYFRVEKAFDITLSRMQPEDLGMSAEDQNAGKVPPLTAGMFHDFVCGVLKKAGKPVPPSSWHRVQLCIARVGHVEIKEITRSALSEDLGFS